MKFEKPEKVLETYTYKGAVIELIERPETIYAGRAVFTDDLTGDWGERLAASHVDDFERVAHKAQPEFDVHISVNFWRPAQATPGFVFGREVASRDQPEGVDVFTMPASLFLRMYTDRAAAGLLGKEACEPWELFAYLRAEIMPKYGFVMAENGAQEIELFEPGGHQSGYAYVAVERKQRRPLFGFKRKSAARHSAAQS